MSLTGTSRVNQLKFIVALILSAGLFGCAVNEEPKMKSLKSLSPQRARLKSPETMDMTKPPDIGGLARGEVKPPTVDEANKELEKQGENWLYGKGFGATTLNIATCVVFPPYILYLLGNAGLELAGYEPIHITDAVPEPARESVNDVYDGVVSVPGRIAAESAGEEFREK